ncbi:hypothetical protein SDC9_170384 [bioreactor metagenome]|uniref:Uncharacterized protein n=1 Tax=bioreactor metagenome TaxID=1076179 RepID=A0A645GB38_9ZZZZ
MDDYHLPLLGGQHPHVDILHAAAELNEGGVLFVADADDFLLVLVDDNLGVAGIRDAHQLHLGNHDGAGVAGEKAPAGTGHLGRVAGRRHHGGLLRSHGNHILPAVDDKVQGHAHRQGEPTHHIFNHVVRLVQVQGVGVLQNGLILRRKAGKFRHLLKPLLGAELKEAGITAGFHETQYLLRLFRIDSRCEYYHCKCGAKHTPKARYPLGPSSKKAAAAPWTGVVAADLPPQKCQNWHLFMPNMAYVSELALSFR